IRAAGAIAVAYPCIAIQPPQDTSELDAALQSLAADEYDWLVVTSANTISSIQQRIEKLSLSLQTAAFKIAAVGESTARAAQSSLNRIVDLVPEEYIAEALASALLKRGAKNILLPESAIARATLANLLRAGGTSVTTITAYETVCADDSSPLLPALDAGKVDVITFTSSSTVTCFLERMHKENEEADAPALLQDVCIACIGSKTSTTAEELGFENIIVPSTFTLEGMMAATETYFEKLTSEKY
ncbi:MAG: uroporphyrinogen-III synthase, partial [Anaerolineae bacterium]|nr:uroporphyrinogen-III synthase [Anaerolineae bacterium]